MADYDIRFVHDSASSPGVDQAIAEYRVSDGAVLRRFVFGAGVDAPVVWYEGAGTADRRFLSADERGSVISVTDSAGALLGINRYDEFGQPQATNLGRFQYTGQMWLPEVGLYYYKARMYEPVLGRFVQTDPIGYGGGANLYAYVLNDPVNLIDPLGLWWGVGPCVYVGDYGNCNYYWVPEPASAGYDGMRGRGGGGGGGATPSPPPQTRPKPQPEPNPEKPMRKCNAFQKAAEDVSDFLGDSASLGTDIAFYTGVAAGAAAAVGFEPGAVVLGAISLKSLEAVGLLSAGSFAADVMAGNTLKGATTKIVDKTVDRALSKLPPAVRGKIGDEITGNLEFSKCK